jgi:hypothetical protein
MYLSRLLDIVHLAITAICIVGSSVSSLPFGVGVSAFAVVVVSCMKVDSVFQFGDPIDLG